MSTIPAGLASYVLGDTGWFPAVERDIGDRWMELPHALTRSRGFVLLPGDALRSARFTVGVDHWLQLEAMPAAEALSPDGLDLELLLCGDQGEIPIAVLHLGNDQRRSEPVVMRIGLGTYAGIDGTLLLRCLPGPRMDPVGDWAAVTTLALASIGELELARSRSQYAWRLANESGHFEQTYAHDLYMERAHEGAKQVPATPHGKGGARRPVRDPLLDIEQKLAAFQPSADETAFQFANRMLAALIPRPPLDFATRLAAFQPSGQRLRMLSLCAGEARIEESLLQSSRVSAELTLVDLSETLLARAAARMPDSVSVRRCLGSVDAVAKLVEPPFDIACFVSGLHHVGALESVLDQVADQLAEGGELWLIGEQVGRNGNRLWPDAWHAGNRAFSKLPAHLRFNHYSGAVDDLLPNVDFSSSNFEGVRSEDIVGALARRFVAVAEDRRNCFLWRCIDLAYISNYDLRREADVQALRMLVAAEFTFYAAGGVGCELNGVYRNKLEA